MTKTISIILFTFLFRLSLAQQPGTYKSQFRVSLDEDFINIRGQGTDQAYTGGVFVDYLFTPGKVRWYSGLWLPKAGKDAVNTTSFGLSYLMFTPRDLRATDPLPNDYPYVGAVLMRHSLFSFNLEKKAGLASTISLGMMGPVSYAREIQVFLHRVLGYSKPRGWNNQLPNDILVNFQLAGEKQLAGNGRTVELISGTALNVGSLLNSASIYTIFRAGKMNPYFSGFLAQQGVPPSSVGNPKRIQAYVKVKPMLSVIAYNSLLQGGIILDKFKVVEPRINRIIGSLDYGASVSLKNFTVSFTQTIVTSMIKSLNSHEIGNVTLYFSW